MTSHAALTGSPRVSATIANETAPSAITAAQSSFDWNPFPLIASVFIDSSASSNPEAGSIHVVLRPGRPMQFQFDLLFPPHMLHFDSDQFHPLNGHKQNECRIICRRCGEGVRKPNMTHRLNDARFSLFADLSPSIFL